MMIFVFVGVVLFVAAIDTSDWFMDEETEYLLYTDQIMKMNIIRILP